MIETDDVVVPYDALATCLWEIFRRFNDPMIVCVVERVASDLLSLRRNASVFVLQGVFIGMRVQIHLRLSMADRKSIVISDLSGIDSQWTAFKRFLECRAHEVVAGTRVGQDAEMYPEPKHVNTSRDENQAYHACSEMACDVVLIVTRY